MDPKSKKSNLGVNKIDAATKDAMEKLQETKNGIDGISTGFEKLDRIGATESNEGLMIAEELSDAMQSAIAQISAVLQEVE